MEVERGEILGKQLIHFLRLGFFAYKNTSEKKCSFIKKKKKSQFLLGASVRNSAHGKGHEEGGLAYAKA